MAALDNQSVLVTGGASGLGAAIVKRYLAEGANVCVLDRSASQLEVLQREINSEHLVAVVGDVRVFEDNSKAVNASLDAFGQLDCVVGNAGIWDFSTPLVKLTAEQLDTSFDEMFAVNVKGQLMLAKAALKPLARSHGSIIYTVSNAGFYPSGGGPLYTTTKHAMVGLIRQLAHELAPTIRVNGVAPGPIATRLSGPATLNLDESAISAELLEKTIPKALPVGKLPAPEEYAGAYVFFASRENTVPTTGSILNHDGGVGVRGMFATRGGDDLFSNLGE